MTWWPRCSRRWFLALWVASGWAHGLAAQTIGIDPVVARPGEEALLTVQYRGEGQLGVAAQFDIVLNEAFVIVARPAGQPACRVNPDIGRQATAFAFVPADCHPETPGGCCAVRALVFDFFDRSPLSDGPLVHCTLQVVPTAEEGDYPITVEGVTIVDASGRALPLARGVAGVLQVRREAPEATVTPLPTPTPSPQVACVGDCNGDKSVTIEEIVAMVASALDERPPDCRGADPNGDGRVTIEELVAAVSVALSGCPGELGW